MFWRFEIESFEEAEEVIKEYIEFCNNNRIHRGIEYKTPKKEALGVCYSGGFG